MKYNSAKKLGYSEGYHVHCEMCERPIEEWFECNRCNHIECASCRKAYHEMNMPLTHPCDWLVMKNDCYAGKYAKDKESD